MHMTGEEIKGTGPRRGCRHGMPRLPLEALPALVAAVLAVSADERICPPEDFHANKGLDVERFAIAPWYAQMQTPLSYQPLDQLFCVRARYELEDPENVSAGIKVLMYANEGRVNGPPVSTAGEESTHIELSGFIPDPEEPGEFAVMPTFLRDILQGTLLRFFFTDHWVVAVGPSRNATLAYDWAIISAGPPKTPGIDGCRTDISFLGLFDVHVGGFWLLTREPVDPAATKIMENVAQALGFDMSVLRKVEQRKCRYKGAP